MDAEKISGIVNDIILESGARTSYTLDDGAVRTVGKAKGRPNAVSVRIKADTKTVLLDVVPAADGCRFVTAISPHPTLRRNASRCSLRRPLRELSGSTGGTPSK